jgi:hypothetical protein
VFSGWEEYEDYKPCPGSVGPIALVDRPLQVIDKTFGIEVIVTSAPGCPCNPPFVRIRLVQTVLFDRTTGNPTTVNLDEVGDFGGTTGVPRRE